MTWLNDFRAQHGEGNESMPITAEEAESGPTDAEYFKSRFGETGWECPPDCIELAGPWAPNGAGFTIWYSQSQGMAYLHAGYW